MKCQRCGAESATRSRIAGCLHVVSCVDCDNAWEAAAREHGGWNLVRLQDALLQRAVHNNEDVHCYFLHLERAEDAFAEFARDWWGCRRGAEDSGEGSDAELRKVLEYLRERLAEYERSASRAARLAGEEGLYEAGYDACGDAAEDLRVAIQALEVRR